ncbi:MAG TPA: ABC transporter ATP-binding protein/permease [Burkholderiales bacterium]|nr:ABC transporter ATP-binding protein/permease [Burkholderiales bacterium]
MAEQKLDVSAAGPATAEACEAETVRGDHAAHEEQGTRSAAGRNEAGAAGRNEASAAGRNNEASAAGTNEAGAAGRNGAGAADGVASQFFVLVKALRASAHWSPLGMLAAALLGVIVCTTIAQVRLNAWNQPFYDAIAGKDVHAFMVQIGVFALIATALITLNSTQTWLHETAKVRLRNWLTSDLLGEWLKPRRPVKIVWSGEMGVNPDQRIHEDARHLSELSADLAIGLTQSGLMLLSFLGVLWIVSEQITLPIGGQHVVVPGYMLWCALLYAATGYWLSWRVGRPLIGLNAKRYGGEAQLRAMLVRASEHADGIALNAGEADEAKRLKTQVERLMVILRRLVRSITRLSLVTSSYGWFAIVVPLLVAAPGYFMGDLSMGGLMMVVGAFNQVQQALRWFVDNFRGIADWQATLLRVASFRQALISVEGNHVLAGGIEICEQSGEQLVLDKLDVRTTRGSAALRELHVEIAPGEHVLILDQAELGESVLFRALAGLWPWGSGQVRWPAHATVMFLSQRPYLPMGSLRAALAYPLRPREFGDRALKAALERTGLDHLTGLLGERQHWYRELSVREQQCLAFARMLLHKPQWVFIGEAVDLLDEDHRRRVLSIFEHELAGTGVVSLRRKPAPHRTYSQTLHLLKSDGAQLAPRAQASEAASQAPAIRPWQTHRTRQVRHSRSRVN